MYKKKILLSVVVATAVALSGCSSVVGAMNEPVDPLDTTEIHVVIPSGASTTKISEILEAEGLVKNATMFKVLSKELAADGKMQAGEYILSKSMASEAMIGKFVDGDVYIETFKFTIPEGFETRHIIDKLTTGQVVSEDVFKTLLASNSFEYRFLEDIDSSTNLEGFLFPETYEMKVGSDERAVINKMLGQFDTIFKDEYYARADELGMTINEVITLASVIEREAQLDTERALVSGVFHNRINKGWKLQSCATVQYILGERKEILSYDDIAIESPYNTYMNAGLPPSPIASPGEKSIIAALYPEKTDYMFFVASGDNNGSHIFSRTLKEHEKAIKSRKK